MRRAWDEFWFAPLAAESLVGPRVVAALTALWLVTSTGARVDLHGWPEPMIAAIAPSRLTRFLLFPLPPSVELVLAAVLIAALALVATGSWIRFSAATSAVLLYRHAAVQSIFESTGPFRHGSTQIVLILIVLTAVGPVARAGAAGRFRWGLELVRFIVALRYLSAAVAKLKVGGLAWAGGGNMTGIAAILATWGDPPLGEWLARNAGAAAATGAIILIAELSAMLAVISRRAAMIVIPLVLLSHVLQYLFFGVVELALPLLLVFLPWERRSGIRDETEA
ncbi:MAG: hypothetical protein ACRD2J_17395 [Thermoanaerobaculia bacterium]